jgi:hypothetical protein
MKPNDYSQESFFYKSLNKWNEVKRKNWNPFKKHLKQNVLLKPTVRIIYKNNTEKPLLYKNSTPA